jgi:hypothetical protein
MFNLFRTFREKRTKMRKRKGFNCLERLVQIEQSAFGQGVSTHTTGGEK